jgi:V/A-type H+-transporting ATPase subunit D
MMELWGEFEPGLIQLRNAHYGHRKIAGVKIPVLERVEFDIQPLNLYQKPSWFLEGIQRMEELTRLSLRRETSLRAMQLLEVARKKTTQKVNLYEKVQIPAYEEAIRKIKRFLEDEANLSKAAQKIMKKRISALTQPA